MADRHGRNLATGVPALSRHRRRHVHCAGRGVLSEAVISSTGTPTPAQWTRRRRCRDRADIEPHRHTPALNPHGRSPRGIWRHGARARSFSRVRAHARARSGAGAAPGAQACVCTDLCGHARERASGPPAPRHHFQSSRRDGFSTRLASDPPGPDPGKKGHKKKSAGRSPEQVLQNAQYSTEIDIWAIGCIFFKLLSGRTLFKGPLCRRACV